VIAAQAEADSQPDTQADPIGLDGPGGHCVVGNCTSPGDDVKRIFWINEPTAAYLDVCRFHRAMAFPEWVLPR